MNNSSPNSSNQSSGFIYFNTSATQPPEPNKQDTTDFLAFSESPNNSPQHNRFQPSYYSSPQYRLHRNSPRQNYNNRGRFHRNSGGNNWSPNSSHNSSRSGYSSFSSYGKSVNNSSTDDGNYDRFMHPSFMEDPWAPLEAKTPQKSNDQPEERNSQQELHSTF